MATFCQTIAVFYFSCSQWHFSFDVEKSYYMKRVFTKGCENANCDPKNKPISFRGAALREKLIGNAYLPSTFVRANVNIIKSTTPLASPTITTVTPTLITTR